MEFKSFDPNNEEFLSFMQETLEADPEITMEDMIKSYFERIVRKIEFNLCIDLQNQHPCQGEDYEYQ